MSTESAYKVSFGRIARTLVYEDGLGTVAFDFDVSTSEDTAHGAWAIHLGQGPITPDGSIFQTSVPSDWVATARERPKQYLVGRGYQVKDGPGRAAR